MCSVPAEEEDLPGRARICDAAIRGFGADGFGHSVRSIAEGGRPARSGTGAPSWRRWSGLSSRASSRRTRTPGSFAPAFRPRSSSSSPLASPRRPRSASGSPLPSTSSRRAGSRSRDPVRNSKDPVRTRARAKSALRGLTCGYGGQRPRSSVLRRRCAFTCRVST